MDLVTIAVKVAELIFTGAGEKIGGDLMTAIRKKMTQAGRQGILEDLQKKPTEDNKSEFQSALERQMKNDKEFENKVRELVEQIELERQKNSPTPENAVTGASMENVETKAGDRSPVDIGNTQGNDIKGAVMKDVKTEAGIGSTVKIGNTTQTN